MNIKEKVAVRVNMADYSISKESPLENIISIKDCTFVTHNHPRNSSSVGRSEYYHAMKTTLPPSHVYAKKISASITTNTGELTSSLGPLNCSKVPWLKFYP